MTIALIKTPRAFVPLLEDVRYKGAQGGRGSAKSHHFAGALVERCLMKRTRAVAIREVQLSIKESVKALIENKIKQFGVEDRFECLEREIRGPHGSLVIFRGMQNHTAASIKSLEDYDLAWVEEAQSLSQRSLDLLTPTIRAPGSELWFSWNPDSPNDPVDKFFEENKDDDDFRLVHVTWRDNPFFPDELRRDMLRDRKRDRDKYMHIWEGKYRRHSAARVFSNWEVAEFETPSDVQFYYGADWGFSVDPSVLVRAFKCDRALVRGVDPSRTLYVDHEAYAVGVETDFLPALFAGSDTMEPPRWQNPYRYSGVPGAHLYPIRADSARPEVISHLARRGFKITGAVKGKNSVEEGVTFLQNYDLIVHPRCEHVAAEMNDYSWKIDRRTGEILGELADKDNHTIDALRYATEGTRRAMRRMEDVL
jgi:phage terminase large subunit